MSVNLIQQALLKFIGAWVLVFLGFSTSIYQVGF
jgi:hypothetical protein